jgi:branched-chain amino acid transport system substrate-binding protein
MDRPMPAARLRWLAVPLLVLLLSIGVACGDDDTPENGSGSGGNATTTPNEVTIGALLPQTGSLSSYGETSEAALKLAVQAIEDQGGKVNLVIEDTGTDAATTKKGLQSLHDKGARLVIGPYASSSVTAVKEYADSNDMVLVSPLSTAKTLAVAGDNVFRFTPDDDKEGVAVAALAWADGIRTIIPISRDDPGNLGLERGLRTSFEALGGKMTDLIKYGTDQTDAADFSDEADQLAAALSATNASGGKVAIYLAAFGEVSGLFEATSKHADLATVPWYGSDSVALSEDLVSNKTAAAFAVKAGYPNPILGLAEADKNLWGPVQDKLTDDLGRPADAFALAAYDALMVGYEALTHAGANASVATLKQDFVTTANEYHGLTGPTKLNPAGDRDIGIYDFWAVCADGSNYKWIRAVSYVPGGSPEITRPEHCS